MYYLGICSEKGKVVNKEYCFGYALDRVINNKDEQQEFVEWYYSGNWIKVKDGDDNYE